eukprot:gene56813-biopygen26996
MVPWPGGVEQDFLEVPSMMFEQRRPHVAGGKGYIAGGLPRSVTHPCGPHTLHTLCTGRACRRARAAFAQWMTQGEGNKGTTGARATRKWRRELCSEIGGG